MFKNSKLLKDGLTVLLCAFMVMTSGAIGGCSKISNKSEASTSNEEIISENKELDGFNKADIDVNVGDVDIVKGDKFAIEAEYDKNKDELSYDVQDNKLILKGKRKDGEVLISFFNSKDIKPMKIKVYVPDNCEMDELKMKLDTGDGKLKGTKISKINIDGETGSIKCSDIISKEFNVKIDTGDLEADGITADKAVIKNSCGSVDLRALKTNSIDVENHTGEIRLQGELKGENIIECDTGSIDIKSTLGKKDYSYDIDNSIGKFELDGQKIDGNYKEDNDGASNLFKIKSGTGDLDIEF